MSRDLKLNDRTIGDDHPTYIIAEMSANHASSKERAKKIIHAAKEAGADCVKIQTYTPDTMTIDSDKPPFKVKSGEWDGENLYELYKKGYTPWEWQEELKEEAENIGLDFFSTPYEKTAVDFLEQIDIDFYKVASFEVTHIPFLKYLASKDKPIIMSTGLASLGEIEEAVKAIRSQGNNKLALLKCSSAYPAIPEDMNLKNIEHLAETFDVPIGLSDHTLGSVSAIAGVAMGASIVEKHLCLSREIDSPDSSFSMEPDEFKQMVQDIRKAEKAVDDIDYELSKREEDSRVFRRSIFVINNIKAGEKFTEENVRVIRPEKGLKPKYFPKIIGKKAAKDIERGTPLSWDLVE